LRPRLLVVGEGFGPTGYARVMSSLLGHLADAFEVTLFAVNLHGPAPPCGFSVRWNSLPGDRCGVEQLAGLLDELSPAVVLLHGNSDLYLMHRAALARRPDVRVAVYCPADWPELVPAVLDSLVDVDLLVMYTEHARRMVGRETAVIPHGVDCSLFAPMSRSEARRRLGLPDGFIVLNANRNQRRKQVEVTLREFASFACGRPDARLYLHMGMRDMGCDVLAVAGSLGITDRLLMTTRGAAHPDVSDEHLNLIYNACDVGLNTAAAEGWGLVSFEHAATGAPQVVPDTAACASLWEGAAIVVPPSHAGKALATLYDDERLRGELGRRGRELASRFSWPSIAAQWEELLLGCLRREKRGTQGSNLESPVLETGALAN
jgi:D-inositol-3-phosphate glycosyltransferase